MTAGRLPAPGPSGPYARAQRPESPRLPAGRRARSEGPGRL